MPLQQTFITQVGIAKETTWATGVAPSTADQFLPINGPKPSDIFVNLLDDGLRGLGAKDYGYYQGAGKSEFDVETYFYPDVAGNLILSIMGTDGWTAGTTHPFTLAAARPPSYSVTDFTGLTATGQARRYAGMYAESLNFKWASAADFKLSAKYHGVPSAIVAKPTATYTTAALFRSWENALTLNALANTKLSDFDCTLKRSVDVVWGSSGTQAPIDIVPGPLEVTGKMTIASFDEAELLLYLNNTQPIFSTVFTDGSNTLTFVMSKCAFESPTVVERSKNYAFVQASFRGIYNTTDSGPCKITIVGGKSGAAY